MQDNLQINSAAITDKGLSEKRPQNEDSYLELRDSGLYAVADGVGGAQAGDVASQMAMEILGEAFINLQEDGDAEERMQAAIDQANAAIYQMSNELSQLSTMATTIVAVHINGNVATIGHVGDSRVYRLAPDGTLFRETQDHSVVEEEVRAGRMTPEQALTHPSRNVISRALGAEPTVEIDMKTIMFDPDTRFLLCSDGVTRHIPDEELRSLLAGESDTFVVCQKIKELCYERGAEDNLTAVVVAVEEAYAGDGVPAEMHEEETVASARPPLVNSAVIGGSGGTETTTGLEEPAADPTPDEQAAVEAEFKGHDEIREDEIEIPVREDSEPINIPTGEPEADESSVTDEKTYRIEEGGSGGIVGRIISGLVWLLLGAIIGVVGGYLWANSNLTPGTGIGEPVMSNEELVSFEQKRRQVDVDPAQFAARNVNPESPADRYFLGRANYLLGNFETARRELELAREGLNEIPEINRKVVENDIEQLLEVIAGKGTPTDVEKPAETENLPDSQMNTLEDMTPAEGQPANN